MSSCVMGQRYMSSTFSHSAGDSAVLDLSLSSFKAPPSADDAWAPSAAARRMPSTSG
eukprot:CAMPEP_0177761526 /NCGR_PEP_ID=MMETSP0491_2-20121128/5853_1 /TAXON_ID=63592 /ORGANISM="Tetraselmis chuii, Strain PLY429" /LENGTH=56 /DNA_ID=CAMNT_0019277509 /DNA_START=817 /DNA_END=987 /DNA_ORIENTATION=+